MSYEKMALKKLALLYDTKISIAKHRNNIEDELAYTIKRNVLREVVKEASEIARVNRGHMYDKGVTVHVCTLF